MADLGKGFGSDYPAAIDTAEQQIDGSSGTVVDANLTNDYGSAIVAIETELGTDPAGSLADVSTRLNTLIAAAGGITSGTTANRPTPASGTFRLYWNTTLSRLEIIKDDTTVVSVAGVTDHGSLTGNSDDDHTQYQLVTAGRNFTGDVVIEKASPALQLKGTETSAKNVRFYEDAGIIYLQEYTGGSWVTRVTIDMATGTANLSAGYLTVGGGAVIHTPAADPTGSTTEGAVWYDSVTDELLYRDATKQSALYPVHMQLPVFLASSTDVIGLLQNFRVWFPSGTKTMQLSACMREGASDTAFITAAIVNSTGASASGSTTSTSYTNIVGLPQFTFSASGWQTINVSGKSSALAGTYTVNYLTIYAR